MRIYTYRKSDGCYVDAITVNPDEPVANLHYSVVAPPFKEGFHAVMKHEGWVLEEGPTPADPQAQMDLSAWRDTAKCSPFQGRVALTNAGKLSIVEETIKSGTTSNETKIAWEYATEWRRLSPMIIDLATKLGMTETEIDDLFKSAQSVSA